MRIIYIHRMKSASYWCGLDEWMVLLTSGFMNSLVDQTGGDSSTSLVHCCQLSSLLSAVIIVVSCHHCCQLSHVIIAVSCRICCRLSLKLSYVTTAVSCHHWPKTMFFVLYFTRSSFRSHETLVAFLRRITPEWINKNYSRAVRLLYNRSCLLTRMTEWLSQ